MEKINLFSIPMFKFKFVEHKEIKPKIIDYLKSQECYYYKLGNGSSITKPNLHKIEAEEFKKINQFIQSCLEESMIALGFYPHVQITGIWATRHDNNGKHHRHQHGNTFLVGVYYLNGNERNSGTKFFNPNRNLINYIIPKKNNDPEKKEKILNLAYTSKFEEGSLIIFPSWIEHETLTNNIEQTRCERFILGINSMPLGPTNNDLYDRFNYQSISGVEMIEEKFPNNTTTKA